MEGPAEADNTVHQQPGMEEDCSGGAVAVAAASGTSTSTTTTVANLFQNNHIPSRELFQQHSNPMMNNVVLKRLFELMSSTPGELNKARLVCRHWYQVALPVWLKNGSTILIETDCCLEGQVDEFLKFLEQVHCRDSPPPINTHHQNEEDSSVGVVVGAGIKQYRKFHLESLDTWYRAQYFELFWDQCGVYLTHLTLTNYNIVDSITLKNILLCKHTPNLEYLVVDLDSIEVVEPLEPRLLKYDGIPVENSKKLTTLKVDLKDFDGGNFPLEWKFLLNRFPKLKHFGFGRYLTHGATLRDELLMAIKEIRNEDRTKLELKSFQWAFNQCFGCDHHRLAPTSLPPLLRQGQLNLNLETLSFAFLEEVSAEDVHQVLSIYAPTLKKLQIYTSKPFKARDFPFPEMSQLRTLEISGFGYNGTPVKDLTFLNKLPNLRSLRFCDKYSPEHHGPQTLLGATTLEPDMMRLGFSNLSEFCCTFGISWTANDFTRLLELMPNLRHLGMRLDNTNFPLVCQHLPQLEHLRVYGDALGDDGIIGIGEINESGQILYRQPNIARLQNLKSFLMETDGTQLSANFSQLSVIHGFCNLPHLEQLVIGEGQINPEIKTVLLERIPFAQVKRLRSYCALCGPMLDRY